MKEKYVSDKEIRSFGYALFVKVGVSKEISQMVVNGLVDTSLRGVDSHGIRLIPHYIEAVQRGRVKKNPKYTFRKTSQSTGILNADHGYGIASGFTAMEKAVELAKKSGAGAVAVCNSSHFGAAALYSLFAAKNNMIGLSFTHSDSLVLPHGGKKSYLGTNPLCFAAPCEGEEPFCLDMATSQIPWNKVLVYKSRKKDLERGWAADEKGEETLDPAQAKALFPFGTYKGYGLAIMNEILCSLLTGMPFGVHITRMYPVDGGKRFLGHFFIAIDISKFEKIAVFKKRLKQLMDELRNIPPAKGFKKVLISGDPEKEHYGKRLKNGIPISQDEINTLINLAHEFKIDKKLFSFFQK